MRWLWYIFLIILGFLTWLTFFSYPSGGSFDWTVVGSHSFKEKVFFPKTKTFISQESLWQEDSFSSIFAMSSTHQITTSTQGTWEIRDLNGSLLSTYESEGIPFFKGNRLFQVMLNNTIIQEIDLDNNIGFSKWKIVLTSSLTSLSLDQGFMALGLSSGEVLFLDSKGNILHTFSSNFLEDSLILGVSLAFYQGNFYLAFVEGLRYSFLSIYKLEGQDWALIARNNLGESLKKEYSLFFNEESSSFFTNSKEGVLFFNIVSQKSYNVLVKGFLLNVFSSNLGVSYLLTAEKDKVYLSQVYHSKILRDWSFDLKDSLSFEWLIKGNKSFLLSLRDSYFWVLEKN